MKKTLFTVLIVACSTLLLLYFSLLPGRTPSVNKTTQKEGFYEVSDTTHYCNSDCNQYFSTNKTSSIEEIAVTDTCYKCGKTFSAHHVKFVWWWYETDEISNGL